MRIPKVVSVEVSSCGLYVMAIYRWYELWSLHIALVCLWCMGRLVLICVSSNCARLYGCDSTFGVLQLLTWAMTGGVIRVWYGAICSSSLEV